MRLRNTQDNGSSTAATNTVLQQSRSSQMTVAAFIDVCNDGIQRNEAMRCMRRHPAWNPALEGNPRFAGSLYATDELIFAREVLARAFRIFGVLAHPRLTNARSDGRIEVADAAEAAHLYCQIDDWCILETTHPGACHGDRDVWLGPDVLYPPATELVQA